MRPSMITLRTPMIRFLGKRTLPKNVDHTPQAHPESPTGQLPSTFSSFAAYRKNSQTYGPLGGKGNKSIEAGEGEYFARRDLPKRLHYNEFSDMEMENINSGGADVVY